MSLGRPTVLVIHDDGGVLDALTRLFEASGFDVLTAITAYRAQAHLDGDRPVDVVVAPWDAQHAVGGEVYRWALQQRYDLRDQFVFVAADVPPEFDQVVAGRCLAVNLERRSELVHVAQAAVKRRTQLEAVRDEMALHESTQPRLLLADDEPVLLAVIGDFLAQAGFTVTRVESGHAAMLLLESDDFDVMVIDWEMDDGSGADLYQWILEVRPHLAARLVFLSGGEAEDAAQLAPGRPLFRKGQDSSGLTTVLHEIARRVGSGAAPR